MINIKLLRLIIALNIATFSSFGQTNQDKIRSTNFPKFPHIINSDIPGGPLLGQPLLITGYKQEVRTEKHGLAYPALFDWNHDGNIDLLVGEFETGQTGSNIKVYLNEGTNKKPKYSGKYFYATDIHGDTITNHQWCCIGIHPRFVDLDGDGYDDILSGQYNPGLISWWRGGEKGFGKRQFIEQEGYQEGAKLVMTRVKGSQIPPDDPRSIDYWNFSSVSFADYNGDGLLDLFVGGCNELRVAINKGTKEHPKLGLRKNLLGIDGYPIAVKKTFDESGKRIPSPKYGNYAGATKMSIIPIDWDGDGILDLLVTHLYASKEDSKDPIFFFRGVQTDKGLRFMDAKPLFTANDVNKTFPGTQPNIIVTDYNHDGILDLVIGLSLPTINGFEIDKVVASNFVFNLGIEAPGKDIGEAMSTESGKENIERLLAADARYKRAFLGNLNDDKYYSLWHRGYIYFMPGKKNPQKAKAITGIIAETEVNIYQHDDENNNNQEKLIDIKLKGTDSLSIGQEGNLEVVLNFLKDWHAYANTHNNTEQGWIPTIVNITLPEPLISISEIDIPNPKPKAGADIYSDENNCFIQKFKINPLVSKSELSKIKNLKINVTISYQLCNNDSCLPPMEQILTFNINIKE